MVGSRIRHLLLCWLLACCVAAHALDPSLQLTQYGLDNWQIPEGLPQSSAQAIARTPDGYLWIGTQEGLARFDGVRFTVFDSDNEPALPNKNVTSRDPATGCGWERKMGSSPSMTDIRRFSPSPPDLAIIAFERCWKIGTARCGWAPKAACRA